MALYTASFIRRVQFLLCSVDATAKIDVENGQISGFSRRKVIRHTDKRDIWHERA